MVSYFKAGTQWVTQKGNPKGINPDDACGKNVAVQKGTVQADVDLPARQKACTDAGKPEINVLVDADQAKVTAAVQSGKADAMLVDLPPAIAAVDSTGGTLELLGEQYDSAPYGYVLPKERRHRLRRGHRRGAQAAQGRRHLRPDPQQVEDRGWRHQRLRREPDGQLTP